MKFFSGKYIYLLVIGLSIWVLILMMNGKLAKGNLFENFVMDTNISDSLAPRINEDMIRMFEDFKKRGAISETFYSKIIEDTLRRDPERWRQLLEEYREAIAIGEDPLEQEEFIELVTEELDAFISEEPIVESPIVIPQQTQDTPVIHETPVIYRDVTTPVQRINISTGTQEIVRYHIQIAASITPLDDAYLKRLYKGNLEIKHFKEDQWEKYIIGHFNSFAKAREELRKTNVNGAFIIAFVLDQKLIAYKARQVERVFNTTTLKTFHTDSGDFFRVQIAASKRHLKPNELRKIYPQIESIGIYFENEWYKYSIPGAPALSESWKIARSTNIKGAYVVRYQNGKRRPLR
jgi:hypothetical protein